MNEPIAALVRGLLGLESVPEGSPVIDVAHWLRPERDPLARVTAGFLTASAAATAGSDRAIAASTAVEDAAAVDLAAFYEDGLRRMRSEIDALAAASPQVVERLERSLRDLHAATTVDEATEAWLRAFHPQAAGVHGHETHRVAALREQRRVTVTRLAPDPIVDPAREVLFTSNVLLTVPSADCDIDALPYPRPLREAIRAAAAEPQRTWFDHPIQIGVQPAANELLYGLRGLDAALDAEPGEARVTCLLSVSVTHRGLDAIARPYLEAELARAGGLRHLDVVVVTEDDAQRLVDDVIVPALALTSDRGLPRAEIERLREVVGVDGEYGRHYSFLKAVAAFWHVAIDPTVRATFKFDLDQVFPQDVLLAETGRTMLGHLQTPLWGAFGHDAEGRDVELGMLAGALVNERDIGRGLFTPDVNMPAAPATFDRLVFDSVVPQAISTRAEMMERYDGPEIDGLTRALERIHVTGGTTGIRVDALRRHRPFTPTFIGRAEDQAYLLSVLARPGRRLAYAHAAGLIMRHDKASFASGAMAAAYVGKLIGDDVRILAFSATANAAARDGREESRNEAQYGREDGRDGGLDRDALGRLLDPFTGSFASRIPVTLVMLRFALRTLRLFARGDLEHARDYAIEGSGRVNAALRAFSDPDEVRARVAAERNAWDQFYAALDALELATARGEPRAEELRGRARAIIDTCRLGPGSESG